MPRLSPLPIGPSVGPLSAGGPTADSLHVETRSHGEGAPVRWESVRPPGLPHAMAERGDEPHAAGRTLRTALTTVIAASAVPYGYTLAIWGTGAMLVRSRGAPTTGETFIFAAGAIAGFYLTERLLLLLTEETLGRVKPIDRYDDRVFAGLLDWIAVGAALAAGSLLAGIPSWIPWLL